MLYANSALKRRILLRPLILGGIIRKSKAVFLPEFTVLVNTSNIGRYYPMIQGVMPPRIHGFDQDRRYCAGISADSRRNFTLYPGGRKMGDPLNLQMVESDDIV